MTTLIDQSSTQKNEGERNETFSRFAFLKQSKVSRLDIFFLGVTGILSGQVSTWNGATTEGFWVLFVATLMNTIGFVFLICCIAEMTSALPFSGGIYGFVRAFTLPVFGFMVAVYELMMNLFYVSPLVYTLSALPVLSGAMSRNMILVNCLVVYFITLSVLLVGGKVFWGLNALLGMMIMLIFLIYLIGSSTYADFDTWALGDHGYSFSGFEFMKQIPLVSTIYLGMQLMPLTSRLTKEPKKDVPIVMSFSMALFAIMTFGIIIVAVSQYPGVDQLTVRSFPLTFGFLRIFKMNYASARWINIPFLFATTLSFLFFCGRQALCMSKSGLIPEAFQRLTPVFKTPYVSLITFVFLSFLLNIVIYYNESIIRNLFLVTSLSGFIVYIGAFIGYIRFHDKYSSLERYFVSPFGVFGAYCGIMIFSCCFIGGAFFQYDRYVAITIIIVVAFLAFLYFLFISGPQVFSEEEKQELFKAYLVNGKKIDSFSTLSNKISLLSLSVANLATKKRMQKRTQVVPFLQSKSKNSTPTARTGSENAFEAVQANSSPLERDINSPNAHDIQVNRLAPPEFVGGNPSEELKKSFSEKIVQFLSSKMNQIVPESDENADVLQILEAGGTFPPLK